MAQDTPTLLFRLLCECVCIVWWVRRHLCGLVLGKRISSFPEPSWHDLGRKAGQPTAEMSQWGLTIHRDKNSQHDICKERSADCGSSCCTLFASKLATQVLTAVASAQSQDDLPKQLGMQALQRLLARCVRQWDAMGMPGGATRQAFCRTR